MWNVNKIIWPNAKRYVAAIRNHFIQCTIFTTQWTLSLAVVSAQLSPLRMKTQNSDHLQQQRQPNIDKSLVSKHQFNGEKTTSEQFIKQIRNGSFYNFDFIQILLLHLNHVFTQFFLFFILCLFSILHTGIARILRQKNGDYCMSLVSSARNVSGRFPANWILKKITFLQINIHGSLP